MRKRKALDSDESREVGETRKNRSGNLNQDIICEENYFQIKGKIPKTKNLIIQILFLIAAFSGSIDCYEKNFIKTLVWWEKERITFAINSSCTRLTAWEEQL